MALLVLFMLITAYAMTITVFHMKQIDRVEALEEKNKEQAKKIAGLNTEIRYVKWQMENSIKAINPEEHKWNREKERLLAINNKLMERIKRSIPG